MMGFAEDMQKEAEAIADIMEACVATNWKRSVERNGFKYSNIKPWYNPRWMFEPRAKGVDRVLVGINPGGDPNQPGPASGKPCGDQRCDHDKLSYHDCDPCCEPYNDWLDAKCWPKRGQANQKRVQSVFNSLYCENWKRKLVETPCFNVCPLRTAGVDGIPDCVWHQSKAWFKRVIEELRPRTIICNSSAISGKSPWVVVNDLYGISQQGKKPSQYPDVRWGTVSGLSEDGTTVIGIKQRPSDDLYGYLSGLKAKIRYS